MTIPCERHANVHAHMLHLGKFYDKQLCHYHFEFLLNHDWRCISYSYLDSQHEEINQK